MDEKLRPSPEVGGWLSAPGGVLPSPLSHHSILPRARAERVSHLRFQMKKSRLRDETKAWAGTGSCDSLLCVQEPRPWLWLADQSS